MLKTQLSVVIPVFNRRLLVERAIRSVRQQPGGDEAEIVVVDDGSEDGTWEFLQQIARVYHLRLLRHDRNRGVCPARNTGIFVAEGEWIIPLDSDDELAYGALSTLNEIISGLSENIKQVRGMVQWPDRFLTPEPPMSEDIWGYEEYLRAINVPDNAGVESANVYRKTSFDTVRYPDDRSHEMLFHLDWYQRFKARTTSAVLRLYYTDAENRTSGRKSAADILRDAPDHARQVDEILARHGAALKKLAPRAYRRVIHGGVKHHLLAGNRARGVSLAVRGLQWPRIRMLSYLALGLMHSEVLAAVAGSPLKIRK